MNSSNVDMENKQSKVVKNSKKTKKTPEKKEKGASLLVNFGRVMKLVWAYDNMTRSFCHWNFP